MQRDVARDLRDALASVPAGHYAAITEPSPLRALLLAIYDYRGHPCARAALKISPMLFQRPDMIRAMEWQELDLQNKEWRIPARKRRREIGFWLCHMCQDHYLGQVCVPRYLRPGSAVALWRSVSVCSSLTSIAPVGIFGRQALVAVSTAFLAVLWTCPACGTLVHNRLIIRVLDTLPC